MMNKEYSQRLSDFCEANHNKNQKVLSDCHNDIIDGFGGLDTMIHLKN